MKLLLTGLVVIGLLPMSTAHARTAPQEWLTTWATSPQQSFAGGGGLNLDGRTIRERMRVTVGGKALRVKLSNVFGKDPLVIGSATIGTAVDADSVVPGSVQHLTFSGKTSVTIPPGAPVLSDPVTIDVPAGSELSLSLYTPNKVEGPMTVHSLGLRTAAISPPGDFSASEKMPQASTTESSVFVTALLVPKTRKQFTIVAFGDSITDGNNSTANEFKNWPDDFAQRLAKAGHANTIAIVNQGIGGNQLRHDFAGVSALSRFGRDALSIPGVKYIVVLEGINDLGFPGAKMGNRELLPSSAMPTAEDIIDAYKQLIARAHVRGITIYGATLTPFKGTDLPGYYADFKEPVREAINQWIRTSHAFDAVIDFDAAIRDPADPHRVLSRYVSQKDHLHPSDEGYQVMADAVNLALFK